MSLDYDMIDFNSVNWDDLTISNTEQIDRVNDLSNLLTEPLVPVQLSDIGDDVLAVETFPEQNSLPNLIHDSIDESLPHQDFSDQDTSYASLLTDIYSKMNVAETDQPSDLLLERGYETTVFLEERNENALTDRGTFQRDLIVALNESSAEQLLHPSREHTLEIGTCDSRIIAFEQRTKNQDSNQIFCTRVVKNVVNVASKKIEEVDSLVQRTLIHSDKKSYDCQVCRKTFSKKENRQRHLREHIAEEVLKCKVCDQSFMSKSDLKLHEHLHTGEKKNKCNQCLRSFVSKHNLNKHKCVQSGEKPHKCETCLKLFAYKSNLNRHKLSHSEVKSYKCDTCPKSFLSNYYLTVHKHIHTGVKPYKCDTCPKSYSRNCHLNVHKRSHTGEKPYKCDQCLQSFVHKQALNVHKCTKM